MSPRSPEIRKAGQAGQDPLRQRGSPSWESSETPSSMGVGAGEPRQAGTQGSGWGRATGNQLSLEACPCRTLPAAPTPRACGESSGHSHHKRLSPPYSGSSYWGSPRRPPRPLTKRHQEENQGAPHLGWGGALKTIHPGVREQAIHTAPAPPFLSRTFCRFLSPASPCPWGALVGGRGRGRRDRTPVSPRPGKTAV